MFRYAECLIFYCYAVFHYAECHYAVFHYAECHYADCPEYWVIMLSVIMLGVIMLSVIMLSVLSPLERPLWGKQSSLLSWFLKCGRKMFYNVERRRRNSAPSKTLATVRRKKSVSDIKMDSSRAQYILGKLLIDDWMTDE